MTLLAEDLHLKGNQYNICLTMFFHMVLYDKQVQTGVVSKMVVTHQTTSPTMIPTRTLRFSANRSLKMRPTARLMQASKRESGFKYPVEMTPLFIAMGIAICSATFFTTKKFLYDESLRVGRKNPDQSKLPEVLEEKSE